MAHANPLTILHLGAGVRSQSLYFPVYRELARRGVLQVAAVYTNNADRQGEVQRAGFTVTADWRPTVAQNGVDAVVVVVPPEQMALVIESLLPYRQPIVHETPLGRPVGQATALMKKIRSHGVLVATAEQQVFHPIEQLKRQVIAAGHLGKVYAAENHHHTWAYHGVAKLRAYFAGSSLKALRAWNRVLPDNSRATQTVMEFSQNRHATMIFGPASKAWPISAPVRALNVIGDRGAIMGCAVDIREGESFREYPRREIRSGNDVTALEFTDGIETLARWENPYHGCGFNDDQIGLAHLLEHFGRAVRGEGPVAYGVEEHYLDLLATQAMEFSQRLDGLRVRLNATSPSTGYLNAMLTDMGPRHWWLLAQWVLKKFFPRRHSRP